MHHLQPTAAGQCLSCSFRSNGMHFSPEPSGVLIRVPFHICLDVWDFSKLPCMDLCWVCDHLSLPVVQPARHFSFLLRRTSSAG